MKDKILKTRTTVFFLVTFLMFFLHSADLFAADVPTDREISNAVERQFMFHSTTPFHLINVETYDGIVTLSGTVDELLAKDRAVKVAQMVKGVRAVVDEIEVEAPSRSDITLESEIAAALANDPATETYEVIVDASDGIVTLSGMVDSWQEKQVAAFEAKGVK
jgi:osmotically-inducible protein OsmY